MITEETISRVKSSLQATKSFLALEVIEQLEKENAELKVQNEKMKCCQNCKWWDWSTCKHKDGFCKGRSNWEAKK